jgi:DNA polymerase-3 subunit epsilon
VSVNEPGLPWGSGRRLVVLDTETTGLNARLGDRVIEIGCIELVNRRLTGRQFHRYINPQRLIEEGALRVHGITDEFLADKPIFAGVAEEFLDYIRDAELVIHNAGFDVEFLNEELRRLERGAVTDYVAAVHDTLAQAREIHPGKKNSLDALCERYQVDNRQRRLHGALLDATLLAEVYLAMTRGQESLAIGIEEANEPGRPRRPRPLGLPLLVLAATPEELADHVLLLEDIDQETRGGCLWLAAGREQPAGLY